MSASVVGLDLSLTATGLARHDGTSTLKAKAGLVGMARLAWLRGQLMDFCAGADLVVVEGYSMGTARQQSHAHALGELGGVARLALFEAGYPYADVPPASLKRYATGKGNANKGQVLEAASKRSGLDFGGDNNRADAWWLRQMGMAWLFETWPGGPVEVLAGFVGYVRMPADHRAALTGVVWPGKFAAPAVPA